MRNPMLLLAPAIARPTTQAKARTVLPCEGLIDVTTVSKPWHACRCARGTGAVLVFEAYVAPTVAPGAVSTR